jgi:hypothetical protein
MGNKGLKMDKKELASLLKYMSNTYLKFWYNHTLPLSASKGVKDADELRVCEKMVHALWNEQLFLNNTLKDINGKVVKVLNPGTWNMEAGPDFKNASLEIGGRKINGDVEIHLKADSWQAHGHHLDPNYHKVILHVCWETSSQENPRHLPLVCLENQLCKPLDQLWLKLNPATYSRASKLPLAECSEQMNLISDDDLTKVFRTAGLVRLQQKANLYSINSLRFGKEQALYSALADAHGYKSNREAFKQLTLACPLEQLRKLSSTHEREAFLWGSAGLIPDFTTEEIHPNLVESCRLLWDTWWKLRKTSQSEIVWKRSVQRPVNSPERRLAALISLLKKVDYRLDDLIEQINQVFTSGGNLYKFLEDLFNFDSPWERYCNYKTALRTPAKLIGKARLTDILTNVFLPVLASIHKDEPEKLNQLYLAYCNIPRSQDNHILEIAKHRFFIPPNRMKQIIKKAVDQQGLLQLMNDFELPETPEDIKEFWNELGISLERSPCST